MNSYKVKLRGSAPDNAYLDGSARPKKKLKKVVDPGRWEEYLRRMIAEMRKREAKMQAVWADLAKKQAEKSRKEGYREGFEAGRAEGHEEGRRSIQPVGEKLEELIGNIAEERERLISSAARLVVQLACEIAVGVIHDELKTDPDLIHRQVESALKKVVDKERVLIRVHPSHLDSVREEEKTWQEMVEGVNHLIIEEDENLRPGDVVIETNSGIVDARIETQLDHMRKVIMEVMKDGA